MNESNFYSDLSDSIMGRDIEKANQVVMEELGKDIACNKPDFIEVIRNAGIDISDNSSDAELADIFIKNAPINDDLLIGTAFFIADKNKTVGADGDNEVSDTGLKATYKVMNSYFVGNEEKSNWVGAIAKAVGSGANLGSKIVEGRNQKKYGTEIQRGKEMDARNRMRDALLSQREKQNESIQKDKDRSGKMTKILVISGVSLLFLSLGIYAYVKFKKR